MGTPTEYLHDYWIGWVRLPSVCVIIRADRCVNQSQHNRLQSGVTGVYEPSGSDFVVTQAGQANDVAQADVVNPDGSGVGGESTSVAGHAREANAAGLQMDMVTNQNPMDSFVTPY
ncbi:hypothetical protein Tco_0023086 [Tanacetum coccineum]